MRKLVVIGLMLVVVGVVGVIVAHHYRPLPSGYFIPGVSGAPARLATTTYDIVVVCAVSSIVVGVVTWGLALFKRSRGAGPTI